MATQTRAQSQLTITDLTDITDVYLQYGLALANATVTNSYTFSGSGEIGWSTTYPTWVSGYQIWIRQVRIKEGMVNPEYGTPYLDKAINQTNTTISATQANLTALSTKLKKIWINETTSGTYLAGTYAASGINGTTFSESNPQTYGYNTLLRHNSLDFRYNTINMTTLSTNALTFYIPKQQNNQWIQGGKGLEITSEGIELYKEENNNAISIAHFGDSIKLGSTNTNRTNGYMFLESNRLSMVDKNDNAYFIVEDKRNATTGIATTEDTFIVGSDEEEPTQITYSYSSLSDYTQRTRSGTITQDLLINYEIEDTTIAITDSRFNNTYTETITATADTAEYEISYFINAISSIKVNNTTTTHYTTDANSIIFDEGYFPAKDATILITYAAHKLVLNELSQLVGFTIINNNTASVVDESTYIYDQANSTIYFDSLFPTRTGSSITVNFIKNAYPTDYAIYNISSAVLNIGSTTRTLVENTDFYVANDRRQVVFNFALQENQTISLSYICLTGLPGLPIDTNKSITVKRTRNSEEKTLKTDDTIDIVQDSDRQRIYFLIPILSTDLIKITCYPAIDTGSATTANYRLNYIPTSKDSIQVLLATSSDDTSPVVINPNTYTILNSLITFSNFNIGNHEGEFLKISYSVTSNRIKLFTFGQNDDVGRLSGAYAVSFGINNTNTGYCSLVGGEHNEAANSFNLLQGKRNSAYGQHNFITGIDNISTASYVTIEGGSNVIAGKMTHCEGYGHDSDSYGVHIEGYKNTSKSGYNHLEGRENTIEVPRSGYATTYNHIEGYKNTIGDRAQFSHVQGYGNKSIVSAQTVIGTYNSTEADTNVETSHPSGSVKYGYYPLIIGNGTSDKNRSNAFTFNWNGNLGMAGNLYLKNDKWIYGKTTSGTNQSIFGINEYNNVVVGNNNRKIYILAPTGAKSKKTTYLFNGANGNLGIGGSLYVDNKIYIPNNKALTSYTVKGTAYSLLWMTTDNYLYFGNKGLRTVLRGNTIWFDGYGTTSSAANARIGTDSEGRIYRSTASSRKYKYDIRDLIPSTKDSPTSSIDPAILYKLKVRQFRYNPDYLSKEDVRSGLLIPGFIAEEVNEIYPIATDFGENKEPGDWNVRYIVPPMLALIQQQKKEIDELRARIDALENR